MFKCHATRISHGSIACVINQQMLTVAEIICRMSAMTVRRFVPKEGFRDGLEERLQNP